MQKNIFVICGVLWMVLWNVGGGSLAVARPVSKPQRLFSLQSSLRRFAPHIQKEDCSVCEPKKRWRLLAQKPKPPTKTKPPTSRPASKSASEPSLSDLPDIEDPPAPPGWRAAPKTRETTTRAPAKRKVKDAPLITTIALIGLKRVNGTEARRLIFSQEGDFFSETRLKKDVARLRRSGLFTQVRATFRVQQGLAEITFTFKEKELILVREVSFVGTQALQGSDLQKPLELKVGSYFDDAALKRDAHRLLKAYSQIGYFRARLYVQGYWGKQAGKRTVKLEYVIYEDLPARIREIKILGNKIMSTEKIKAALSSKSADILTNFTGKGIYHPYYVAQDRYALDNFFMDRGFLEREIKGPYLYVTRDRRQVDMVYRIKEGPIYRYNAIELRGDILGGRKALRKLLTIRPGKRFDRSELLDKNVAGLRHHYQDAGYAFAKVDPTPLVDQQRKELSIIFVLRKGPLVRIADIEIVGNQETQEHVIRRRILLKKGALFSHKLLRRSQRRIFALGYFDKNDETYGVQAQIEKTLEEDRVNLRFIVRERWTWTILPSFTVLPGYDAVFLANVGKQNFLGLGQSLSLTGIAATSGRLFSLSLQFVDPMLANTPLSLSLSGYFSYNAVPNLDYAVERVGGSIGLGIALGIPALRFTLSYSAGRYVLSPQQNFGLQIQGFSVGYWLRSGLGAYLTYNDRNTRHNPILEQSHSVSFFHISPTIGANYSLNQLDAKLRFFLHLHKRVLFKLAGSLGWMFSLDEIGPPTFERFRLGGDRDLRGFQIQSIAPTRLVPSSTSPAFKPATINWGGSKMFMLNAEMEFVIARRMGVSAVVFFDAGNVYDDNENFFQDRRNPSLPLGLYMNVGFGVHLRILGAGLFRFELGFPLTPRANDPAMLFWLTIGESVF
ncbi:MAG: outer membrane protein assembly factor BamA [Myxococcales bacterium]|nr:outer membrane protein assembly factor BamA [Myxococcales bacterium]